MFGAAIMTGLLIGPAFCVQLERSGVLQAPGLTDLREAVEEFNKRVCEHEIGKSQPALTEDEVVAALVGCVRQRETWITDVLYKTLQDIARTRRLPSHVRIDWTSSWRNFNGHDFDVWWIDLYVDAPSDGGKFRIRRTMIRCWPTGTEPKSKRE